MNIPNSSSAPAAGEYAGGNNFTKLDNEPRLTQPSDEVSAIVLDPGYSSTRAGFAGEDVPKSVCPSFYGQSESGEYYFGENAIHSPYGGLTIKNYWGADGIVEDWDTATKLWEYTITSRLTGAKAGDPTKNGLNDGTNANGENLDVEMEALENNEKPLEDSPLLVTEPGWNSAKAREKYIEIAMEEWGTPAFFLQKTGVLAAFASGKASGIINRCRRITYLRHTHIRRHGTPQGRAKVSLGWKLCIFTNPPHLQTIYPRDPTHTTLPSQIKNPSRRRRCLNCNIQNLRQAPHRLLPHQRRR